MAQCSYRDVLICPSYNTCMQLTVCLKGTFSSISFLASELLQHNVIALVEGSHTKIPACTLATITNIPLIRGNNPTPERCAKAVSLTADYKDYAHASLDIINTFHWKNIALVADGKEHRLYYFLIRLFVSLLVRSFIWSFVCPFVLLFMCLWSTVWSIGLLVVCSCVLLFDLLISCVFRGSFPWSCLLLRNIPGFKVHLESAAAYRERRHKR